MALKEIWVDQNNEVDSADAEVVNVIAHAVINLEKNANSGGAVKSVNNKTGNVVLNASDVGALEEELRPRVMMSASTNDLANKANKDLSNVSDEDFLSKLNAVLPDGDGVSY